MINTLEVKNYKSIRDYKLDKLNQFNVFLGGNSSGKTNLLECVFAVCGGISRLLMPSFTPENSFEQDLLKQTLFSDMDISKDIEIKADCENMFVGVRISTKKNNVQDHLEQSQAKQAIGLKYRLLSIEKDLSKESELNGYLDFDNSQYLVCKHAKGTLNTDVAHWWSSNGKYVFLKKCLHIIIIEIQMKRYLTYVNRFDKRIINVFRHYIDIGQKTYIPFCYLSDTILDIMSIIAFLMTNKNCILILDNYINSLKSDMQDLLFEIIMELSIKNNIQVFMSCVNNNFIEDFKFHNNYSLISTYLLQDGKVSDF